MHKTTGASIVYVTHDQIEAMTLAIKIVVLKDGIVQQVGTPAEIYRAVTVALDFDLKQACFFDKDTGIALV